MFYGGATPGQTTAGPLHGVSTQGCSDFDLTKSLLTDSAQVTQVNFYTDSSGSTGQGMSIILTDGTILFKGTIESPGQ